jgi:hypothetical protein
MRYRITLYEELLIMEYQSELLAIAKCQLVRYLLSTRNSNLQAV